MSKTAFVSEGRLEEAIAGKQHGSIIRLIAEGERLGRPDILATKKFFSLPIRTAATVIGCGMDFRLRTVASAFLKSRHPETEVIGLMEDMKRVPKENPSADEEELMQAVTDGNDWRILRLIMARGVVLECMSSERLAPLCRALRKLKPHTVVLLFAEGICYAAVPSLLKFLLRECERPCSLRGMGYKGRLMFTNLLIHILQEEITPDDEDLITQDWYPMGGSVENCRARGVYCRPFSYYYDPRHIFMPRFADGEYETPKHIIR